MKWREGNPSDVLAALPRRIGDVIVPWAAHTPDRPAIVEREGSWTYGELSHAVAVTRQWLNAQGVRPGDRVMVIGENCRAMVAAILAIDDADAWPVLVNARLSAREVDELRIHCSARCAVYTTGISAHARAHAERRQAMAQVIEPLGTVCIDPCDVLAVPEAVEIDGAKQVGALIYTSGSTGRPKGVMLSHRNMLFIAATTAAIRRIGPNDCLYGVMPLSHSVGLSSVLLCALFSGASVYLSPRFSPAAVLDALGIAGITIMLGTPTLFSLLAEYARSKGVAPINGGRLRIISASGAPLDEMTKMATECLFNLPLHHGYGATECSPTISQTRPDRPRKDLSVGPPLPGVEVRLVRADGTPAPEKDVGELFVRGPNVMKGYYKAEEETAAVLDAEGWFRTRDLARMEEGNLFLVGREKEMIIRFGFNISPYEVESVINTYPGVLRSAVIGRDSGSTEEIIAFVQAKPEVALTPEELQAYLSAHLASYKQPSKICFVDEISVTENGKIGRRELVDRYLRASPRAG